MHLPFLLLTLLAPLALSIPNPITPALLPRVRISGLPPPPCNGKLCPDSITARDDSPRSQHPRRYIIPGQPGPTCLPGRPCPDKAKRVDEAGLSYPPCIRGRPCSVTVEPRVEEPGQSNPPCVRGACPEERKVKARITVGPCGGRGGIPCPPIPPAGE